MGRVPPVARLALAFGAGLLTASLFVRKALSKAKNRCAQLRVRVPALRHFPSAVCVAVRVRALVRKSASPSAAPRAPAQTNGPNMRAGKLRLSTCWEGGLGWAMSQRTG